MAVTPPCHDGDMQTTNRSLIPAQRPRRLLEAILPTRCAGCRTPGSALCPTCRAALQSSPSVHLDDGTLAACRFDGVVRSVILSLKYGNRRAAAPVLAGLVVHRLASMAPMSHHVSREFDISRSFDVVTWAPTSSRRSSQRGYDQAELLARHVARQLGLPCRRLLYRSHGDPQTGKTRVERLGGPSFRSQHAARPVRVLLVDDVVTTGATLRAAAMALRAAGVGHVTTVAVAATPPTGAQAGRGAPGRLEAA